MNSATGGQIQWDLDVNKSKFDANLRQASGNARNFARGVDKENETVNKSFSKMGSFVGTAVKRTAIALGVASTAALGFSIKSAASFEQTRIGLENMLGSADKARSLLGDISRFAAETPFEFPELAQATRQLVAFGFSAGDAFKTMQNLGDVSAAIGAPINDLAYLMGTLRAQGRAFTIDIRQFAMRGIPIYEYLAKVLKTNTKEIMGMIEEGKIGFPQVEKAFKAMTAEGGAFHNTMARQSKSLSGLMSTLKDNLGFVGRELIGITKEGDVVAGSIFDRLRNGASSLIGVLENNMPKIIEVGKSVSSVIASIASGVSSIATAIGQYLGPKFQALANSIVAALPTFQMFLQQSLIPIARTLGSVIVVAIGLLIDQWNLLINVLRPVIDWINRSDTRVRVFNATILSIVGAIAVFKASLAIQGTIKAFTSALAVGRSAFVAFRGTLSVPITISIVAGAALLAMQLIIDKGKETLAVLDELGNAQRTGQESIDNAIKGLRELAKSGTPEQQKRAKEQLKNPSIYGIGTNARGTNDWRGGPTWVGEKGPEIVNLPRHSQVIPSSKSKRMTQSESTNVSNQIGTIIIGNQYQGESWLYELTRQDEITSKGLIPHAQYT